MSLFDNPVTLADGAGTPVDHDFSFLSQDVSNPRAVVGTWIEDDADTSAESKLVVKHDQRVLKSGFRRDLLQRTVKRHPAVISDDDSLHLLTINITITGAVEFSDEEVEEELGILVSAVGEADFVKRFRQGHI
jgi:hypothetical protein